MVEASKRQAHRCQRRVVATSRATQTLLPGPTGRHWMKSVPHLSSHDGSGWVQLEGFAPTRNRKVVGSNPTSGSKTARQSTCTLSMEWAGGQAWLRPLRQLGAGQLLSSSRRWVALIVGEVAVELLAGRYLGDGVDQVLTADEGALPGRAPAPERLSLVAPGAGSVDADLEGVDLVGQLPGEPLVVAGDGGDQAAVGGVHLGHQLGGGVDQDHGIDRAEGLGMAQGAGPRRLEQGHRGQ